MNEVTISTEEYKNLLKAQARIEVFADFVNTERYSVSRGMCAKLLGFELEKPEDDD